MAVEAFGTILALMSLLPVFVAASWDRWRAVLKAAFALPLDDEERALLYDLTGRLLLPTKIVRELWLIFGRRSGKSIIAGLIAIWATVCRAYTLAPGEVGVFMVIASDRRQARVVKRYISGLLQALELVIGPQILRETADAIWLTNGLCIEIHTCSFRALRGYTVIGAVVDEVAFWAVDGSANPDREVLVALRAAMASIPEAMLVALTTPYARRGEAWRVFEKYFGNDASDAILVVNASTDTMNPTIDPMVITDAYTEDPVAAEAEYGAKFRSDVESLVTREVITARTVPGRAELPYSPQFDYRWFGDPAGGSGGDSFTLSGSHTERHGDREIAVLDVIREARPPFSPEEVVAEFAAVIKAYGGREIVGDRYAGEWPREAFRKHGIEYTPSDKTKSEIYRDALPMLNSGGCELLDHPRLHAQLAGLERRAGRGGRESIDHGPNPNSHDDVANAVCGALLLAMSDVGRFGGGVPVEFWG